MKALVTGGGGFLGGAIIGRLVARGDQVRSLARGDYPALRALGVDTIRGDVAAADDVLKAVEGVDIVFHVAAKAGVWGRRSEFVRANVEGTRNVVEACRRNGIGRLVHTSSPSVVAGPHGLEGVDESTPYLSRYDAPYPETKAQAERLVLGANGPELATVALRPHLIWGPGDNHLVPRIIDRARRGRLRRVGDGSNVIDATYIDNAALAHVLAGDRLGPGAACAGRAYFIAQGEPIRLWELVDRILHAAGLPPLRRSISPGAAKRIGGAMELVYRALRLRGEPPMTRFLAEQLGTPHWFDLSASRRDLGYEPEVSTAEGLGRLADWLRGRGRL